MKSTGVLVLGLLFLSSGISWAEEQGLVGYWRFDDRAGHLATDSSTEGNDGSIKATWTTAGRFGSALQFDGDEDYVNCGRAASLAITDAITLEAWVNGSGSGKIVCKSRVSHGDGDYDLTKSRFVLYVDGLGYPKGWKAVSFSTPDNVWVHITAVYDGTHMRVYINGKQEAAAQIGAHTIDSKGGQLGIGANLRSDAVGSGSFSGIIDKVRIYNRALTAAEVKSHFESSPKETTVKKTRAYDGSWDWRKTIDRPFQQTIEPREYDIWAGKKERIYLCGLWKLLLLPNTEENPADDAGTVGRFHEQDYNDSWWREHPVPWRWSETPFDGVGWYRTSFQVPKSLCDKRVVLHFERAEREATVFVNGAKVGTHRDFYLEKGYYCAEYVPEAFDLDITEYIEPGEKNVLAVRVWKKKKVGTNDYTMGGIWQPVWLDILAPVRVEKALVAPSIEGDISVECRLVNETGQEVRVPVIAETAPWRSYRYTIATGPTTTKDLGEWTIPAGHSQKVFSLRIDQPRLWSLDEPYLYHLRLVARMPDRLKKTDFTILGQERFGLREFRVAGNALTLNGKRCYLPGEQLAGTFQGGTDESLNANGAVERFLRRLKGANQRYFRTHSRHMPEPFYDIADEIGVLICDELPAGVAEQVCANDYSITDEMAVWLAHRIKVSYNHPSIVVYSMGNERWDSYGYNFGPALNSLYDFFKSIDQTRLVISSSGRFGTVDSGAGSKHPSQLAKSDFHVFHDYVGFYYGNWLTATSRFKDYWRPQLERMFGPEHPPMFNGECITWLYNYPPALNALVDDFPQIDRKKYADIVPGNAAGIVNITARWLQRVGIRDTIVPRRAEKARAKQLRRLIEAYRMVGDILIGFNTHHSIEGAYQVRGGMAIHEPDWYPGLGYRAIRDACNPLFVCLGLFNQNLFTGSKLQVEAHVMNDTFEDQPGLRLRFRIRPRGGSTLEEQWLGVGDLAQGKRRIVEYSFDIPPNWPTRMNEIEVALLTKEGDVASASSYDFFTLAQQDNIQEIRTEKRIALFEREAPTKRSEELMPLAEVLRKMKVQFQPVKQINNLGDFDVLIIDADAVCDRLVEGGETIHAWLADGGRLLVMEQTRCQYVPWLTQAGYLGGWGIADIIVPEHPIFAGLTPESFQAWDGFNLAMFPTMVTPLSECMLATGYTGDGTVGMVVGEVEVGKGLWLFSNLDALRRYGADAVATRYVQNVLAYTLEGPWDGKLAGIMRGEPRERTQIEVDPHKVFFVNLRKHCNRLFQDDNEGDGQGGWSDQGANDMRNLPTGDREFLGVPMRVLNPEGGNTCIVIQRREGPDFLQQAKGIVVERKADRLFFLLSAAWCPESAEKEIARLVVHYAPGQTPAAFVNIKLVPGENIADWWARRRDLSGAALAWEGPNGQGDSVAVYLIEWKNPYPFAEITSLDFVKEDNAGIPILIAVSGETP